MSKYSLDNLRLTPEEKHALRTNGFVSGELRGRTTIFKLRFRQGGRQQVRYVGTSLSGAEALRAELVRWQARRQLDRQHRQAQEYARRAIREISIRLAPHVAAAGLYLHGRTIREPRRCRHRVMRVEQDCP